MNVPMMNEAELHMARKAQKKRSLRGIFIPLIAVIVGALLWSVPAQTVEYWEAGGDTLQRELQQPAILNGDCPSAFESEVVFWINFERSLVPAPILELDVRLQAAARRHSLDMLINGVQWPDPHTGSDGSTPPQRISEAGYVWTTLGETIGLGHTTPREVVDGWMDSPLHRDILLDPAFIHVGVGYEPGSGSTDYWHYWTAAFGNTNDPRQAPPSYCDPQFLQSFLPIVHKN